MQRYEVNRSSLHRLARQHIEQQSWKVHGRRLFGSKIYENIKISCDNDNIIEVPYPLCDLQDKNEQSFNESIQRNPFYYNRGVPFVAFPTNLARNDIAIRTFLAYKCWIEHLKPAHHVLREHRRTGLERCRTCNLTTESNICNQKNFKCAWFCTNIADQWSRLITSSIGAHALLNFLFANEL